MGGMERYEWKEGWRDIERGMERYIEGRMEGYRGRDGGLYRGGCRAIKREG